MTGKGLVGKDHGQGFQLIDIDAFLTGKGAVFRHQKPVYIFHMKIQIIVFFLTHRSEQQSHIRQAFVDTFCNSVGVAAVSMEIHIRIPDTEFGYKFCDHIHGNSLSASDINISA